MNIEEIVNEHTRKIIKNIFNKLDNEEKYVILELNNQLQDKINKIDKAIKYMQDYCELVVPDANRKSLILKEEYKKIIEILGDK